MAGNEKVTLSLPSELMAQVRELSSARGQSQFIAEAISYYLSARQRRALRERLIAGYQVHTDEDAGLAELWRAADDEAWLDAVPTYNVEESEDGPTDSAR
jgi:hypothetical protein